MLIKEAIRKKIMVKRNQIISPAVYGCDECSKEIDKNNALVSTVFHLDGESSTLDFCSWSCVFKNLPKIKTNSFMSLPYVYFDGNQNDNGTAKELIELTKKKGCPFDEILK